MKYIALTALESHWAEPHNTLFLGEWCRIYDTPDRWQAYPSQFLSCPWLDHAEMEVAETYCNNLTEILAVRLATRIEERLQLNQPYRFYERIFWPWLLQFVQIVYDRYLSIIDVSSANADICFLTAPIDTDCSPARDSLDYTCRYSHENADWYNLILFSEIIGFLELPQKVISITPQPQHTLPGSWEHQKSSFKKKLLNLILYRFNYLIRKYKSKIFVSAINSLQYLDVLKRFKGLWQFDDLTPPFASSQFVLDSEFRQTSLNINDDKFLSLLSYLIPKHIPWGMLEALPSLVSWAKKHPARRGGVFVTSTGPALNIPLLCLSTVSGRPLVVFNHGGGDVLRCNPVRNYDQKVPDCYVSTGWTNTFLPSPILKKSFGPERRRKGALLVTTDVYRYAVRFFSGGMPSGVLAHYHGMRLEFLKLIPAECRPKIRLYFKEFGWNVQNTLKKEIPGLEFQNPYHTQFCEVANNSALIVIDYPVTTFHQCMAANKPMMLFCSSFIYKFTEEAQPIMNALEQEGIYHQSAESAAKHYLKIYNNPDEWWFSPEVQKARNLFCSKYAMNADDWASAWDQKLNQIISDFAPSK